jgi:hypothetical protein
METEFKKLSECRTCLNAGHSGQMIGFIKVDGKVKPDGKPVWELYNENMTKHVHNTAAQKKVSIPDMAKALIKPDFIEPAELDIKEQGLTKSIQELNSSIVTLIQVIRNSGSYVGDRE